MSPRRIVVVAGVVLAILSEAGSASGAPRARNLAAPAVHGSPSTGSVLTTTTGRWSRRAGRKPSAFAYAWLSCDAAGRQCAAIPGARSASFALRGKDAGRRVRVRVTALWRAGHRVVLRVAALSRPTAVVRAPTPPPAPPAPSPTPTPAPAPPAPPSAPGAPTAVTGRPGNGQVTLSWRAPASDGGRPVTGYRIVAYLGGVAQPALDTGSAATSRTVGGLANGSAYTFRVIALNAVGAGPGSSASAPVTPATFPGAPTAVRAAADDGAVDLNWRAPVNDGGQPVTGYRITPLVAGVAQPAVATESSATTFTVTGLANGTTYRFRVAAVNAMGTGPPSQQSTATTPESSAVAPLPLISRAAPAFTNDDCHGTGPAGHADDSAYGTRWTACESPPSSAAPTWLALDLSSVPAAARDRVLVAWFNDPVTKPFDPGAAGVAGHGMIADFAIETAPGPGGGSPPSTGWTTRYSATGNRLNSRQQEIDMSGDTWLRLVVTASEAQAGDPAVAANVDVYDASGGLADDWIFYGDATTQDAMLHDEQTLGGSAVGTFSELVQAARPDYFPVFQAGGTSGLETAAAADRLPDWLFLFPGRFVVLAYGTEEAVAGVDPSAFHDSLASMIEATLSYGKRPVVPTIPWSRDAGVNAHVDALNAAIESLYAEYPKVIPGPDLAAYFAGHQDLIGDDGIHPTDTGGAAALRRLWANFALSRYPQS